MKPITNIGAKKRRRKPKFEPLSKAQYASYIRSHQWQETRKRFWKSKLPKHCYGCGVSGVPLDLHHKSYKTLGKENLNHLALVCRECHERIHDLHKNSRYDLWKASNIVFRKTLKIDITEPNMASKQREGREKPMART